MPINYKGRVGGQKKGRGGGSNMYAGETAAREWDGLTRKFNKYKFRSDLGKDAAKGQEAIS